jgi:mono/diheme cytochrome c family protein
MTASVRRWPRILLWLVAIVAAVITLTIILAPETARAVLRTMGPLRIVATVIPPTLPANTEIKNAYWLPQNWHARDRYWFHHITQGTATHPMPYDWFIALEQPGVPWTVFGPKDKFSDAKYLSRFGFIPSPPAYENKPDFGRDHGFRPDPKASESDIIGRIPAQDYPSNPDGLPVGFARLKADPATGMPRTDRIGLTCAACHTGHLEYKNVSLRFDGGAAAINLQEYEKAIALSLFYTKYLPFRFGRFADNVLGKDRQPAATEQLKQQLSTIVDTILTHRKWTVDILESNAQKDTDEGFARLDALNRIGNQVFFEAMLPLQAATPNAAKPGLPPELIQNFASVDAPVSFPPIWYVPWFRWAQYDASVHNELVRNAGEALGVKAIVDLTAKPAIAVAPGRKSEPFRSSVQMSNIFWIEELLRGGNPFEPAPGQTKPGFRGLQAPHWKDAAAQFPGDSRWAIDPDLVMKGRKLYREHCVECHHGPARDDAWEGDSIWTVEAGQPKHWTSTGNRPYYDNVQKPAADVGTDRQQARVLTERQVYLPPELGIAPIQYLNKKWDCGIPEDDALNRSFVLALMTVVDKTIEQWFSDHPDIGPELKKQMWGPRSNCPNRRVFTRVQESGGTKTHVATVAHYRARPLDGIWATAPYLHNGSVPTLYDLLLPQGKRPPSFCIGDRQFDPVKVGLAEDTRCEGLLGRETGLFRFDTSKLGNSNRGHSFEGAVTDPKLLPRGVLGREFTDDERKALVAYLKQL